MCHTKHINGDLLSAHRNPVPDSADKNHDVI